MSTAARRITQILTGTPLALPEAATPPEPAPAPVRSHTPEEWWLAWAAEWEATAG